MIDGSGVRVLVVDDDEAALASTRTMLEFSKFEVHGAPNGALGLEEVITFRPEVVVFDFWMPVADGRELLQGIREVARVRLGLVAMSGTPEVEDWCGRVGVSHFLRKPFERGLLLDAVGRALDEARTASVRVRSSSSMPAARRLRVDRAVMVVGDRETVRPIRQLLREAARPIQVASVEMVEDAVRALSSFQLDAIAVCGKDATNDERLSVLVAEASVRGLPIVLDRPTPQLLPDGVEVRISKEVSADDVVAAIHDVVAGPRSGTP